MLAQRQTAWTKRHRNKIDTANHVTVPLYHITHRTNLPSILATGKLWCDNQRARQSLSPVGIAHQHIKARRAQRQVPCCMSGTLADYVPMYFGPRSPMLYSIHNGFVAGYEGTQEDVVYLVTDTNVIAETKLPFTFTDGHAEIAFSRFFTDLDDLNHVDMPLMRATYWNDTQSDGDRKRRRQAEFLVHDFLPFECFHAIGVINARMEAAVNQLIVGSSYGPEVSVRRGWYY